MNIYRKSGILQCAALVAVMMGTPSYSSAEVTIYGNADILYDLPPIIAATRNGIPEGSGRGIQKAAGPFYSKYGKLGGVIFNDVGVEVTLRGGDTPAINYQVDGDTPFNLPVDNPPVPIVTGSNGWFRNLGKPKSFLGRGSRPQNGLTVPNGVWCTESVVVNLTVEPISALKARAFSKNSSEVVCKYSGGDLYDRIDNIELTTGYYEYAVFSKPETSKTK